MSKNRNKKKGGQSPNKTNTVNKATRSSREAKGQIGTVGIETVRKIIEYLRPIELSDSNKYRTYQYMLGNDAIFSAVDSRGVLTSRAQDKGYIKYNKESEESKKVKDFFQWNMDNLVGQTPRGVGATATEGMLVNGHTFFEKVYSKRAGDYSDKFTLNKLSPVHPLTLHSTPLSTTPDGNEYTYLNQSSNAFMGTDGGTTNAYTKLGYKQIPWNKVALASYSSTYSQPLGVSPMDAAYDTWRELILLREITQVGIQADLSGLPILKLPISILSAAAADPTSKDAAMVEDLKNNMANMHTGDQSFMILPSDSQSESGNGNRQYEITFLGVEGGGKAFDLVALMEQCRRNLLTVFGSNDLSTGESGSGSYNLLEGQSGIKAFYAERDNSVIEEMYNKNIFPQLLRLNEWEVSSEDMPVWVSGEVQPLSNDEVSKSGQRSAAVGLFPKNDPIFLNEYYKKLGYDYRFDETLSPEEVSKLTGDDVSRSGDGMTSGLSNGVGDSTGSSGDANTGNNESVSKGNSPKGVVSTASQLRLDGVGVYKIIKGKKVYLDNEIVDDDTLEVLGLVPDTE